MLKVYQSTAHGTVLVKYESPMSGRVIWSAFCGCPRGGDTILFVRDSPFFEAGNGPKPRLFRGCHWCDRDFLSPENWVAIQELVLMDVDRKVILDAIVDRLEGRIDCSVALPLLERAR